MLRRVVSLMLLPCLLLTQSAALGHAHGGVLPAGHGLRPHFHLASVHESHGHRHGPDGHHHHDADDEPDTELDPVLQEQAPHHDHDAVYFSAESGVTLRERPQHAVDYPACLASVASVIASDFHGAGPPPLPRPSADGGAAARPLYIRHLALLI
jgi:hypothetical protein